MSATVIATGYLVVKATRAAYGPTHSLTGLHPVSQAKIIASRKGRPPVMERDEVLIKVSVELPVEVFDPITPEALIVVPADLVLNRHVIEVTATEELE